jgi:hypothetical protein
VALGREAQIFQCAAAIVFHGVTFELWHTAYTNILDVKLNNFSVNNFPQHDCFDHQRPCQWTTASATASAVMGAC